MSFQNIVFCYQECVFTVPLPSDGCPIVDSVTSGMCLTSRCLAIGICITIYIHIWKGISKSAVILTSVSPGLRVEVLMAGTVIFFSLQICSCKLDKIREIPDYCINESISDPSDPL
jgi:hypothetical protein